jgi:hypothetical protein
VNSFHWMAVGFLVLVMGCLTASYVLEGQGRQVGADSMTWAASILSVFCVTSLVVGLVLEVPA